MSFDLIGQNDVARNFVQDHPSRTLVKIRIFRPPSPVCPASSKNPTPGQPEKDEHTSSRASHTHYISSHSQNTLDVFFIDNADTRLLNRGRRKEKFSATYVYGPSAL